MTKSTVVWGGQSVDASARGTLDGGAKSVPLDKRSERRFRAEADLHDGS